ncbi:helix-turn-helix transcriptional regulator [Microbacterium indicum]|uniref:helix-turn-helix transcriptional regulator n=1 Tax=Microbacterium indicum TaxID=358100 RepID=UPI0004131453|nr:hypothetical protein [Microbacterium indicum]
MIDHDAPVEYVTPKQVNERFPWLTVPALSQLRYIGKGPKFLKPTPRTVVYRLADVIDWIEASERTSTADAA